MNGHNFDLIAKLECVYIEPKIKLNALNDLLTYNINQNNVYDILLIADFYQYKRMEELIEKIQILILDGKIKIEYDKLKKEDLYNSIYINECLREGKTKCDLGYKIHDVCCVKYLESKGYTEHIWAINYAGYNGQTETIKYLANKGYVIDENVMNYAATNGQMETVKYLESRGHKGTQAAIKYATLNGHLKIIKYLVSKGYEVKEDDINNAASNGHIEMIIYLESKGFKGNKFAICNAASRGHLETIKYLESKGYKGDTLAIHFAAGYGHVEIVKYLIEKEYNFVRQSIDITKSQEIKDLLEANMKLMIV